MGFTISAVDCINAPGMSLLMISIYLFVWIMHDSMGAKYDKVVDEVSYLYIHCCFFITS